MVSAKLECVVLLAWPHNPKASYQANEAPFLIESRNSSPKPLPRLSKVGLSMQNTLCAKDIPEHLPNRQPTERLEHLVDYDFCSLLENLFHLRKCLSARYPPDLFNITQKECQSKNMLAWCRYSANGSQYFAISQSDKWEVSS